MLDLTKIYNAFDSDQPLPADDDVRYVDLSEVRGQSKTARKLVQKILNAPGHTSHHLLMGHTKCGKTTELLRTQRFLEEKGYATVFFDVADIASRTFEYTTVLLLMAGQVVEQLSQRKPKPIEVRGVSAQKLAEFLLEKEITRSQEFKGEATGKLDAKLAPGFLAQFLGHLGLGLELRGGFGRSRDITLKLEADTKGFLSAVQELIEDACTLTREAGFTGLVVICDGCDKLALSATDEAGKSHDLQRAMFVDHAPRQGPQLITFDGITVDLDSHHVSTNGKDVRLTPKQFEVFNYLIANANVSIPHAKILQAVWGPDYGDEVEYLHVVVNQIRKKIEPDPSRPRYIVTEPWLGYRFQLPSGK